MYNKNNKSIINISDKNSYYLFSKYLKNHINANLDFSYNNIVFLCIGTDRSTGDSLGPIVGYKLSNIYKKNISIIGNLEEPVHAKNLSEKVAFIKREYANPFIIAIDACLGKADHIGYINITDEPIYPGAGVNKNLNPVGNISITGIVNISGFMEYIVLQNTRLNIIMKMADIISQGILLSLDEISNTIENSYKDKRKLL